MNKPEPRFRLRMGCGEPLSSRWARPVSGTPRPAPAKQGGKP